MHFGTVHSEQDVINPRKFGSINELYSIECSEQIQQKSVFSAAPKLMLMVVAFAFLVVGGWFVSCPISVV